MDTVIKMLLSNPAAGREHISPFLWLHGESEEALRDYMRAISEAGIGAVCVESRPHPDFLGPQWWHDLDVILDEAKMRDMKVWILDDSHFPTGFAGGALVGAEPELCRQSLVCRALGEVSGGGTLELTPEEWNRIPDWTPNMAEQYTLAPEQLRKFDDDRLLALSAVKTGGSGPEDILDLTARTENGMFSFTAPAGSWKVYALSLTRNRGPHRAYINMMNRESCRVLIDTVYETHWAHYRDDFGKTIAGFFSDEPEIGNGHLYESGKPFWQAEDQAWSAEVEDALRETLGADWSKLLPLLWEQEFDGRTAAEVRLAYMNAVTNAVKRDFSLQIGDWCRSHGVEYIGHLIEDNNQHLRCGSSLGHYFRGLWGQDMAGIDCIGGQVFPLGEWDGPYGLMNEHRSGLFYHYVLGKLGASLAALDPKKRGRCMCEIFGNYGWEEGVRLEKYLTDHFLVRGVNYFVPHAFSPKTYPDADCPPHFYAHGHNPQYRHFGALMGYLGRMCALFSNGRRDTPVAVLYSAEGDWTGKSMALETVVRPLADRQIEYDFLPLDVFLRPEEWNTVPGGSFSVNGNRYQALLIPGCDWITGELARTVSGLAQAGIFSAFVGRRPACMEEPCSGLLDRIPVLTPEELPDILDRAVRLEPDNSRVRCMHYLAETERYLLVNEGTECYRGTVHLPKGGVCYRYNAWENCPETLNAVPDGDETVLNIELWPGKSLVILFDTPDVPLKEPLRAEGSMEKLNDGWTRSMCHAIEHPRFEQGETVCLPDRLAEEQPDFSGFVRYERGYAWDGAGRAVLEITDAGEGVEVFVNGGSLGIQIAPPFLYDLTGRLKPGENRLCIEAATTLERENAGLPDMIRQYMGLGPKVPVCPSGIHGEVRIWKQ